MPSTHARRDVLRLCGVTSGLVLAGCIEASTDEPDASNRSDASNVSDEAAEERALSAETRYLTRQLEDASCLETWGTRPTTASRRATVVDRTAHGVYVEVTHPYSYSTESVEADGASEATYLVTDDGTARKRGDHVYPC